MTDEMEQGAWIIATYKVLSKYSVDDPSLDSLEAIITAGRAADLFSSTRSLGTVDADRFERYRKISRLKPSTAKAVLKLAETSHYVSIKWTGAGEVEEYRFVTDSKNSVLRATSEVFSSIQPTGCAVALLALLQMTIDIPSRSENLKNRLSLLALSEPDINGAMQLSEALGLISVTRETEGGQTVVLNPYLFQHAPKGAEKTLLSMSAQDQDTAHKILEHIRTSPGIPCRRI